MERQDLTFTVAGDQLAAWLFLPEHGGLPSHSTAESVPCIVMAHGFSAVRDQGLAPFAEAFAKAGYAALVFDYRHFGDSAGEPRQLLDIRKQLDDWRAAIRLARSLPALDADRIIVWGTSFSGGHALKLAVEDQRVVAAIAQGPYADGLVNLLSFGPRQGQSIVWSALRDQVRAILRRPPLLLPAVGDPGSSAVIATPDAVEGFKRVTAPDSTWRNEVAARIGLHVATYRPGTKASKISCPLFVGVMSGDLITPPAPARKAAAAAPKGELHEYDGEHFDVYAGPAHDQLIADELAFLSRAVPIRSGVGGLAQR